MVLKFGWSAFRLTGKKNREIQFFRVTAREIKFSDRFMPVMLIYSFLS